MVAGFLSCPNGRHTSIRAPFGARDNRVDHDNALAGKLPLAPIGAPVALPPRPSHHPIYMDDDCWDIGISFQAELRKPRFLPHVSSVEHARSDRTPTWLSCFSTVL